MDLKEVKSSFYKIEIPQFINAKIVHLCNRVHEVEWSGVLFYEIKGTWEDEENPLTVICKDILVQDIGTLGYTEFNVTADVMSYALENNLLDCYQGLIHSHNNMPTFFSTTDTKTLLLEGQDRNHFVSLIVNNAGLYTAAITRHITSTVNITEEFNYPSFEDTQFSSTRTEEEKWDYIEWFKLQINIDKKDFNFDDVDSILKEITEKKKKEEEERKNKCNYSSYYTQNLNKAQNYPSYKVPQKDIKQPIPSIQPVQSELSFERYPDYEAPLYMNKEANLEDNLKDNLKDDTEDMKTMLDEETLQLYRSTEIDENLILHALYQICTCSLIIPNLSKFNFDNWAKVMLNLFDKRFKDISDSELDNFFQALIDLLVTTWDTSDIKDLGLSSIETMGLFAFKLRDYIEAMMVGKDAENKYLTLIYDILSEYIY